MSNSKKEVWQGNVVPLPDDGYQLIAHFIMNHHNSVKYIFT